MDFGCPSAEVSPDALCCAQGDMLDENTWESSPQQDAAWLDYAASRTWRLHTAGWTGNRVPVNEEIWIAFVPSDGTSIPFPANDSPGNPNSEATLASGNLGEVAPFPGLVEVQNATCSPYLARVLIFFSAPPDAGLAPDMKGGCQRTHAGAKDASGADGD
jgi:hypothetical protein